MPWLPEDYAEDFDPKGKREGRKMRKILQAKDRSKHKKTDQPKTPVEFQPNQDHKRGRILSIKSEGILVDISGTSYLCSLRGHLKKEKNRVKNLVTVGDIVHVLTLADNEGSIVFIEKRYSHLSRAESLTQRREQILAANIDQVLITTSVLMPPLKPALIDRYIIAAKKGNMQPVIVINKIDLLDNATDPHTLEEESKLLNDFCTAYGRLGFPLIKVSVIAGQGIDELKALMKDQTSVFSGQSGVGKSSLINAAIGTRLKTGEVTSRTKKGIHTTTSAKLIRLEGGGFCVDTPGIRSFGVWDLQTEDIRTYFPDIHNLGLGCKFPNCTHMHEPDCAVKHALETGELSTLRFDSYSALMANIGEEHKPR